MLNSWFPNFYAEKFRKRFIRNSLDRFLKSQRIPKGFQFSSKSICTFSPNTENIREEKNKVIHSSPLSVQKLTKERKSAQFHFELFRWTPTSFGKQPSGDPNGVKRKKRKEREREKKNNRFLRTD